MVCDERFVMKKVWTIGLLAALGVTSVAFAATEYHVYRKKGSMKCEIDMRDHAKFENARGSGWICLGHDTSRIDAEKIFKEAGCEK